MSQMSNDADVSSYVEWDVSWEDLFLSSLDNISADDLFPIRESYLASARRIWYFSFFPGVMFKNGYCFARAEVWAREQSGYGPFHQFFKAEDGQWDATRELALQLMAERNGLVGPELTSKLPTLVGASPKMAIVARATTSTECPSFRHLMESQIITCWTTFETLVGDLWEIAVNLRPNELIPSDASTITVGDMRRFGFDVGKQMGTITRGKFNFTILDGIRIAYKNSFDKNIDGEDILNILDSKELRALSAVRNVIVHKAAKCDDSYIRAAKGIDMLPTRKIGEDLLVDGKLTGILVSKAMRCCANLIVEVDKWLQKHPDRRRNNF